MLFFFFFFSSPGKCCNALGGYKQVIVNTFCSIFHICLWSNAPLVECYVLCIYVTCIAGRSYCRRCWYLLLHSGDVFLALILPVGSVFREPTSGVLPQRGGSQQRNGEKSGGLRGLPPRCAKTLHPAAPHPSFQQGWPGQSPWYNLTDWLGVKHQVTYWPGPCGTSWHRCNWGFEISVVGDHRVVILGRISCRDEVMWMWS